jgi:predicted porin
MIWNATDMFSWAASIYSGKENICDPTAAPDPDTFECVEFQDTNRFLFDTVLTFKPVDGLALILNYDYGKQDDAILDANGDTDDAEWEAIVGYVNYQFNDLWRVSFRAEQYNDKDGWKIGLVDLDSLDPDTGELISSEKTQSLTLTVGYAPTSNFELRAEVRQDKTDEDALVDGDSATDNQTFVALEGLYKF